MKFIAILRKVPYTDDFVLEYGKIYGKTGISSTDLYFTIFSDEGNERKYIADPHDFSKRIYADQFNNDPKRVKKIISGMKSLRLKKELGQYSFKEHWIYRDKSFNTTILLIE